jgi:hypothetical protein
MKKADKYNIPEHPPPIQAIYKGSVTVLSASG